MSSSPTHQIMSIEMQKWTQSLVDYVQNIKSRLNEILIALNQKDDAPIGLRTKTEKHWNASSKAICWFVLGDVKNSCDSVYGVLSDLV